MRLFSLTSSLHQEIAIPARNESFIQEIEAALGFKFEHMDEQLELLGDCPDDVLYVRTGGTEGIFRKFWKPEHKFVRILTSGQSNSLAASMEIVSYLRLKGARGFISHGSAADIATSLTAGADVPEVSCLKPLKGFAALAGARLGVVGRPSDWLISSDVDYAKAKSKLGVELIDIPMSELLEEVAKQDSSQPEGLKLNALNPSRYGKPVTEACFAQSLRIYGALKCIAVRHRLDGLSLRCFDLLTALGNTGCLALAILNSEGITATCEGDIPALLTMELCKRVCGTPGFQVNLSKIEKGTALFAHCTVPLNLVSSYCYDTHFESGIGVAIHGEFEPCAATIVKLGASLDEFMAEEVSLVANSYGDNLCRTQVLIKGPDGAPFNLSDYFLTSSLGNHHVIVPGRWAAAIF